MPITNDYLSDGFARTSSKPQQFNHEVIPTSGCEKEIVQFVRFNMLDVAVLFYYV